MKIGLIIDKVIDFFMIKVFPYGIVILGTIFSFYLGYGIGLTINDNHIKYIFGLLGFIMFGIIGRMAYKETEN